jgi:hypothetical protein
MAGLTLDHRTLAAIALSGTALNLLGGLYLTYDLFGGKHGPLRTLTRAVTYGVLFFLGYVVLLPVSFSILAALGTGTTLAIEFARAGRGTRATRSAEALASVARSAAYGLGSAWLFGWRFGVTFGVLTALGQIAAYRMGFTPAMITRGQLAWSKHILGVVNRMIGYALAGLISAWLTHSHDRTELLFSVGMGVALGAVSAALGFVVPIIEDWADRLPIRRLGIFGTFLIFLGFVVESVEHWVVLFDVPIK